MAKPQRTARELLTGIGVSNFNATMVIPYLFTTPAATDPKSPQVIMMVQHLQRILNRMGADIAETGYVDVATAAVLERVVGPSWQTISWSQNIGSVLDGQRVGFSAAAPAPLSGGPIVYESLGGPLDFLPDVPGGLLTYAIGGYFLWKHLSKKRAA
jgi:hypothetical protein